MSKFKVGDKVLVKRPRYIYEEPFWRVSAMDHLHGRVATIIGFDDDGWLRIDGERWVLSDAWCELVIHEDPTTLTRRDRFAMSAMCGLIAQSNGTALSSTPAIGADFAYRMADAMEAARNKEGGE